VRMLAIDTTGMDRAALNFRPARIKSRLISPNTGDQKVVIAGAQAASETVREAYVKWEVPLSVALVVVRLEER
jgi:hypothetical protein